MESGCGGGGTTACGGLLSLEPSTFQCLIMASQAMVRFPIERAALHVNRIPIHLVPPRTPYNYYSVWFNNFGTLFPLFVAEVLKGIQHDLDLIVAPMLD